MTVDEALAAAEKVLDRADNLARRNNLADVLTQVGFAYAYLASILLTKQTLDLTNKHLEQELMPRNVTRFRDERPQDV